MIVWPLPIEVAIHLAAFVGYPALLILMIATALLPSATDRLSFWALALANGALCYAIFTSFDAIGDRFGIGAWIAFLALKVWVVAIAAGLAVLLIRGTRDAAPTAAGRAVFAFALGVLAPAILLFWVGIFSRWPGVLVFVLLLATLAICLHQAVWARGEWLRPRWRPLHRATCLTLAVTLAASLVLALVTASQVDGEARFVAAGRPYCIYPSDSFADLSILTFREPPARRSPTSHRGDHGLLVVETAEGHRALHWSYSHGTFRSVYVPGGYPVTPDEYCRPL